MLFCLFTLFNLFDRISTIHFMNLSAQKSLLTLFWPGADSARKVVLLG